MEKTIFEEIADDYPQLNHTKIRNVLAAFLFTNDDVFKRIADLSGGERGRVSLAKLMLSDANFLILDEPTRGIDVAAKAEIYAIIDALAASGVCIIMIYSELQEIINMCNRCYVMCEGKITGEISENEFSQETMMKLATQR